MSVSGTAERRRPAAHPEFEDSGLQRRRERTRRSCERFCLVLALATPPSSGIAQVPFNPDPVAVLTQRYSPQRNAANVYEHVLTVEAIASPDFQKLYTIPVDGQVYAQPLLVPQVKFTDGTLKNVLIVATMKNNVAAFQVDDAIYGPRFPPTSLWIVNVGAPLAANFMSMGYSDWGCFGGVIFGVLPCWPWPNAPSTTLALPPVGDQPGTWVYGPPFLRYDKWNNEGLYNINPYIGITSTPVIDRTTNTLYAVARVSMGSSSVHSLVAIDLVRGVITGTAVISGQVTGSGPDATRGIVTFDPTHHLQRPALLLQGGQIYIAFGSHQDTPPWHGWVFRYDARTLSQTGVWCSTPNSLGGAVWQAGSGLAADAAGNVYVMTGNGCNLDSGGHCGDVQIPPETSPPPDTSYDTMQSNFANMFVRLAPDLSAPSSVAPPDIPMREQDDLDLGSSGPVFVPGTTDLVASEKEGRLFVVSTNPFQLTQSLQAAQKADDPSFYGSGFHHVHGTPVFWRGPQGIMTAYFWAERDFLRAFNWDDATHMFSCKADANGCQYSTTVTTVPDQQSVVQAPNGMPGGILSISAQGAESGTAVLWASIPLPTDDPDLVGGGLNRVVPGVLRAFDPEDITREVWNSERNPARDGSFMFAKFVPPVVANGRVYVATAGSVPNGGMQVMTGSVNVYGLRQWAKLLAQTYPTGAIPVGGSFSASMTFFNAGTTTWTRSGFVLRQSGSEALPGPLTFPLPADVAPGGQVTFELSLPAPVAGLYHYGWQLFEQGVEPFGETSVGAVQVGGRLSVAQKLQGTQVALTVADASNAAPVTGATLVVHADGGDRAYTTGTSGSALVPNVKCIYGYTMGNNGKPIPIYGPCHATVKKSPLYGSTDFFLL